MLKLIEVLKLFGLTAFIAMIATASAQGTEPSETTPPNHEADAGAPTLDAEDVSVWLDGVMTYAQEAAGFTGAVVVVVKDGEILVSKGYGYADPGTGRPVDPDETVFRQGSISKLFTWTAVMQLVEEGKLDLNADVNTYLDFEIPPYRGEPISLHDLLTQTPGFQDIVRDRFAFGPGPLPTLGEGLSRWIPKRIYPPGEVPAYSNWGTALAGYIVARRSGEPFEEYIENHIFKPLSMTHSSFRQPLPEALQPNMAVAYLGPYQAPAEFENVAPLAPAGALSASATDMARFMIAHLNDGRLGDAQILKPETARLMHAQAVDSILPGMALGFYHQDRNGYTIIGHGGDTALFHTDLHLFPELNVGLYIAMNGPFYSANGPANKIRPILLRAFQDRYFPGNTNSMPTIADAEQYAEQMEGSYISSRRPEASFFRLVNLLGVSTIKAGPAGELVTPGIKTTEGAPKQWRPIGPYLWQEKDGETRLAAVLKNDRVFGYSVDGRPPVAIYEKAKGPYSLTSRLFIIIGLGILAIIAISWPLGAFERRMHGAPFSLKGLEAIAYRVVRTVAVTDLICVALWAWLIPTIFLNVTQPAGVYDPVIRILQALGLLGFLGLAAAILQLSLVWRGNSKSISATIFSILAVIGHAGFMWLTTSMNLFMWNLNY